MSRSLRRTLLLRTSLATAAVLVLSGAVLGLLVRDDLRDQFDRALDDKARVLASAVFRNPGGLKTEFDELDMGEFERETDRGFLEIFAADGTVVYRSDSLGRDDLPRAPAAPGAPSHADLELPGDRDGRAVTLTFHPLADEPGTHPAAGPDATLILVLARETTSLNRVLGRFWVVLSGVALATILVMCMTVITVIGSGLKPMAALTDHLSRLDASDLDARLPADPVPAELQPVVWRLNELLDRLEAAFDRERAFSANTAHELRTPLAGLRTALEVSLTRPRSAGEYRETLEDCLHTSVHLHALVENLLALARLDAGSFVSATQPVDLAESLGRILEAYADAASAKDLRVKTEDLEGTVASADPSLLDTVLRNLVDNAVTYADHGGTIAVSAAEIGIEVEFRIVNTGCTLDQVTAEALCDRFRRGDSARTLEDGHTGLGLALVRSGLEAMGGRFSVRIPGDGRYEASIRLPRVRDPQPGRKIS